MTSEIDVTNTEGAIMQAETQSPEQIIEKGRNAAKVLAKVIAAQKDKVVINGKQYLQFHDWQTIAKFFNCTVGIENSEPLYEEGKVVGYEAKAYVTNAEGVPISSAESSCYFTEKNWQNKEKFQVRSMAQTRACVKALKNVFSWVIVLAGYNPDNTAVPIEK